MRVVTLNLWGDHAPLPARLAAAGRALAALAPDAILLQEIREEAAIGNTALTLAALLGGNWSTVFEVSTPLAAGAEGLAILTRAPADERAALELPFARPDERRILLSVRLGDVWLHTTHLHWRLADGVAREAQVLAASAAARARGEGVHILGGDFNAPPDADEIRFLAGRTTLGGVRAVWQDAYARARANPGDPGVTWASRNPMTHELAFLERDRRIDYLWVSPETRAGRGRIERAAVVLDAPDEGGTWPSDHFGVMADVSV